MRYQPGNGIRAERAEMIPKLLPERRDWLERELRKWPQLLDYNKQLLDALADPELQGSRWLQPDGSMARGRGSLTLPWLTAWTRHRLCQGAGGGGFTCMG